MPQARPPIALSLLLGLVTPSIAGDTPPEALVLEARHGTVTHLVAGSLQSFHYASKPIGDPEATLWLEGYLDSLDPGRVFLLASDVAAFRVRATEIDDDATDKEPRLALALDVFSRFQQRATTVFEHAEKVLAEPDPFDDPDAFLPNRGDDPPHFANQDEALDYWALQMRAEALDLVLGGEELDRAYEIVGKRYARRARDVASRNADDLLEIYLSALAQVFDPHSAYFKPASSDDFDIRMRDALEGIGAELRLDDAYTTIHRLIPGGPAEASGLLRKGDQIVAVAQADGDPVDVVDMRLDEVVKLIRGEKGTEVRLTIRPANAADRSVTRVVPIQRDRVVLERASAKGRLHEVTDGDGQTRKVGVIEIPSFYFDSWAAGQGDPNPRSTTRDVERAVHALRDEGAEVLLLDFRGNGGGPLNEAVTLTGLFIDEGPVVQVRDPRRGAEVLRDEDPGVAWAGPLVVLTDELSASASEIVAGALQDHGRAVVVGGSQTHGKGTVQSVIDLGAVFRQPIDNAGALKLTIQKFYRVSGGSTQQRGVVPDVVLPSPWEGLDVLESDLDRPMPWDEISPARYTPLPMNLDLEPIREASASRVASEKVFAWIEEDRKDLEARRAKDRLSLHYATRKAERDAGKADTQERRAYLGLPPPPDKDADPEDIEDDMSLSEAMEARMLDEAARIAVDVADRWTLPAAALNESPERRTVDVPKNKKNRKDK